MLRRAVWGLVVAAGLLAAWWSVLPFAAEFPLWGFLGGVGGVYVSVVCVRHGPAVWAAVAVPAAAAAAVAAWWAAVSYALDPPRVWLDRPAAAVAVAAVVGVAAWTLGGGRARATGRGARQVKPLRVALAASGVRALGMPQEGEPDPVKLSKPKRVGLGEVTTVTLPDGVVVSDLLGRAEKVAGPLGRQETDVIIDAGGHAGQVVVWVGDKGAGGAQAGVWPGVSQGWAQRSALEPIDVGLDRFGQPVTAQLHGGSGMLIGSLPGQGKSSLMNLVLASVLSDSRAGAFIIDCKGGADFSAWKPAAERFYSGAPERDPEALLGIIRAAHATMEARYARLPGYRASKIGEDLSSEPGMGPLLLVVDEAQELLGKKSATPDQVRDEALRLLLSIIARGRAVNVWPLLAGQRVTDDEIPASITQRVTIRVAFRLGTQPASQAVLGPDAWGEGYRATRLPAPGVGYIADDAGVRHLRAWFVPDDAAYELAASAAERRSERLPDTGPPTPALTPEDTEVLTQIEKGDPPVSWLEDRTRELRNRREIASQERAMADLEAEELARRRDTMQDAAASDGGARDVVNVDALADDIERAWPAGKHGRLRAVWVSALAAGVGVERDWLRQALADAGAPLESVRMRSADGTQSRDVGLLAEQFEEWRRGLSQM